MAPTDTPSAPPGTQAPGLTREQAASKWAALASATLQEGTSLDDLARKTLDGPAIAVLYVDRPQTDAAKRPSRSTPAPPPASQMPEHTASASLLDNRVHIRNATIDDRRRQILDALEGGATSLELPVDDTGESLHTLLSDVFLDMAGISLQAGEATTTATDALMTCWDERDISARSAIAELNADPYASLARQGRLERGVEHELDQMTQLAARIADHYPRVAAVGVDTALQHNAGASPRLELIAGIATASRYLDALLDAGLAPEASARQLVFRIAVDSDWLMSIVKIRSLRRLWQHVLHHLGIAEATVRIVAVTSTRELTTREPWMNHLRHVAGSMAAVLGGVDSLIVLPHDHVDGRWLDDDHRLGDRMARNVALVLQEESGMNTVRDPMAGAYAAEHLTDELCRQVWQGLRDLQAEGGYLDALVSGAWQQRLTDVQARRLAALTTGDRVMVGVNRFVSDVQQTDRATPRHEDEQTGEGASSTEVDQAKGAHLQPRRDAQAFENRA